MRIFSTAVCVAALSAAALAQQSSAPATPPASSNGQAAQQAAPLPAPAHPITADQIKEMQAVTKTDDLKKHIVATAMQYYRSAFPPFIPQDVIDDLDKSLQTADLNAKAGEIYPKYISTEDAAKIIEFYKTPAGQHLVVAEPYMISELQRSAIQIAQDTARDVITRHKAEIEAAQQKYAEQHQQSKPSLNAPAQKPSTQPKQ